MKCKVTLYKVTPNTAQKYMRSTAQEEKCGTRCRKKSGSDLRIGPTDAGAAAAAAAALLGPHLALLLRMLESWKCSHAPSRATCTCH